MDVASSLLFFDTPFNPLIICSCFMLCLTACSLGETTGALPVDEEGGGKGEDSATHANTAQENKGGCEVAYLRAAGRPGHDHVLLGQGSRSYRSYTPSGSCLQGGGCRNRRWEETSHIPGFSPLRP